jgi:hypothetical protein
LGVFAVRRFAAACFLCGSVLWQTGLPQRKATVNRRTAKAGGYSCLLAEIGAKSRLEFADYSDGVVWDEFADGLRRL